MTDYISVIEVIEIHKILVDKYGGSHGIRDRGALEAALYRPQSGYYDDIIQEAAALWESLSQNHPFIDGNKLVAFAITHIFLKANNIKITASAKTIITFLNNLYTTGTFEYKELEKWLRKNTFIIA